MGWNELVGPQFLTAALSSCAYLGSFLLHANFDLHLNSGLLSLNNPSNAFQLKNYVSVRPSTLLEPSFSLPLSTNRQHHLLWPYSLKMIWKVKS